ncbi:MAG: glycosyltransferase [Polyangiaceae bacterium]|nr:glycosyltransferase [Polyangiaceae bacterium]
MSEATAPKRCLICAAPDLNLVDGSSVWAQTIALALASTGSLAIDFLAPATPVRNTLFGPLMASPRITVVDGPTALAERGTTTQRLSAGHLVTLAAMLDEQRPYDLIVVRGYHVAQELLPVRHLLARSWLYLTDIQQRVEDIPKAEIPVLRKLAADSMKVLCQSSGFVRLWHAIAPDLPDDRFRLYAPVIPDPGEVPLLAQRERIAVYAGKYTVEWKTLEMARLWRHVRAAYPDARLVMIGDKIHSDRTQPSFADDMRRALKETPGVEWVGAIQRADVQERLAAARVALSWRSESMNDTLEYSTKILEYGGAGCPVVLNRNALHEELLGADYPLYANSPEEFVGATRLAFADLDIAEVAAQRAREVARCHRFSERVATLRAWLRDDLEEGVAQCGPALVSAPPSGQGSTKKRVLVAGHDLKFFRALQEELACDFDFEVDRWSGHATHDEARSRKLLQRADIVFCEWCLGNLTWYSHNKAARQRLYARFHHQEINTSHLVSVDPDAVDCIIFVSEHQRAEALAKFHLDQARTVVVPNAIDVARFGLVRKTGDASFALGMVGVTPSMKRLDLALDCLDELRRLDARYSLRIKGKHPFDYPWLCERPDEVAYYMEVFRRINSSALRHAVVFDPPGDNVPNWLSLVHFVLSPSDFESFHVSVAEGMATGCEPIVWDRPGARDLWPVEAVVANSDEAAQRIDALRRLATPERAKQNRSFVVERYALSRAAEAFRRLLEGEAVQRGARETLRNP